MIIQSMFFFAYFRENPSWSQSTAELLLYLLRTALVQRLIDSTLQNSCTSIHVCIMTNAVS